MNLLIKNANIITMDGGKEYKNGCIGITDDTISYIGSELPGEADRIFDAHGQIVMPGLVNTHTHVPMSLLRGYADDLALEDWLFNHIFPIEDKMTADDAYRSSMLSCLEMIEGGTTMFNDMYFFSDKVADAAIQSGLRAHIGRCLTGPDGGDERIKQAISLYEDYNKGKIKIDFMAHAVYTCSPEFLERVSELACEYNTGMHVHLSETMTENSNCINQYGKTPARLLYDAGIFNTRTVAAHCVFLNDDDIALLREKHVSIAHNPVSNLKLASGIAPVAKYIENGLNVSIGTDGASSNNNQSMLKDMQLAALIHKGVNYAPVSVSAYDAIKMATVNGAAALGEENEIGILKVGMKADMIFIDTDNPHVLPLHNLTSAVVYSAQPGDVNSVMVGGEFLMKDKEFLTLDCERIKAEATKCCSRLFS